MVKTRTGAESISEDKEPTKKPAANNKSSRKPAPTKRSAPKAKNRVAPAKPPRRPVAPAAAARAEGTGDRSDSSSASQSGTTTTTGSGLRPGLPIWVQKQFASDIEASGGIASFKTEEEKNEQVLARLCDTNVSAYGAKGDPRREQLRKKLYRWKKLHEDGYYADKVLNRLGVKSAANLRDEEKRTGKKPHQSFSSSSSSEQTNKRTSGRKRSAGKKKPHLSSSSSSSSEASSKSPSGSGSRSRSSRSSSSDKKTGSSQLEGRPPIEIQVPSRGLNVKKPTPKKKASRGFSASVGTSENTSGDQKTPHDPAAALRQTGTRMDRNRDPPLPPNTVSTQVDIERPEANREVMIFKAKDIPGVRDTLKYFFGYIILVPIDPRHILDDTQTEWFKARVFAFNQVLLSMPSFEYTILKNRDAINRKLPTEFMCDAIDHGRIDYEQNSAERQMKHILLKFPSDHVLSASEIYEEAGEDETLEPSMVPVKVKHPQLGDEKISKTFVAFTVARTDISPYKKGKLEVKNRESKAAQLLQQSMAVNDDDDADDDDAGMSSSA